MRGNTPEEKATEATGVTAKEYRRAKVSAILLPVVVIVGTGIAFYISAGDLDGEEER